MRCANSVLAKNRQRTNFATVRITRLKYLKLFATEGNVITLGNSSLGRVALAYIRIACYESIKLI